MTEPTQPYTFHMRRGYDWKVVIQTAILVVQLLTFVFYGGRIVERQENIEQALKAAETQNQRNFDHLKNRVDRVEDKLLDLYDRSIKR